VRTRCTFHPYNDIALKELSTSNASSAKMIKSISKLFAISSGKPAGVEMIFHPSQTCPECGSKLFKTDLAGSPGVSPHHKNEKVSPQQPSGKDGGSQSSPLGSQDDAWRCPNPDCPVQIRARIEHWCSPEAMDIAGGDAGMAGKLVGIGLVRDVAELYRLKPAEIASLEGMDGESVKNFFNAIVASRKREAWRLLFGLGIADVSAAQAQSLCRHFGSVDNVFAAGVERLMTTEGVSPEAARNINQWHGDGVNRRLVRRLFKAGLNFKS
jgi:NAD-dependent DNA ligase